jgi:hypothetical protein
MVGQEMDALHQHILGNDQGHVSRAEHRGIVSDTQDHAVVGRLKPLPQVCDEFFFGQSSAFHPV